LITRLFLTVILLLLAVACNTLVACDPATPVPATPVKPTTPTSPYVFPEKTTVTTPPFFESESPEIPRLNISIEELKKKKDNSESFVLVDVRPSVSFVKGYIEGALSIPLSEIQERRSEIPLGLEVIVYAECA
jgi:hypothetical protein